MFYLKAVQYTATLCHCFIPTGTRGITHVPTVQTFPSPTYPPAGHHRIHSECGPCYTENDLREQFGVSINVWRLAGDSLNITSNFLYFYDQVHGDFLIALYYNLI
jgi:hypothetical protein